MPPLFAFPRIGEGGARACMVDAANAPPAVPAYRKYFAYIHVLLHKNKKIAKIFKYPLTNMHLHCIITPDMKICAATEVAS